MAEHLDTEAGRNVASYLGLDPDADYSDVAGDDEAAGHVLSVRIDRATYQRLRQTAHRSSESSVSGFVRRLLEEGLDRRENVGAADIDAAIATLEALRSRAS